MSIREERPTMASFILDELGVDIRSLCDAVSRAYGNSGGDGMRSENIETVMRRAEEKAIRVGCAFIDADHVVLSALDADCPVIKLSFQELRMSPSALLRRGEQIMDDLILKGHIAIQKLRNAKVPE
jgi:hypothetical protein